MLARKQRRIHLSLLDSLVNSVSYLAVVFGDTWKWTVHHHFRAVSDDKEYETNNTNWSGVAQLKYIFCTLPWYVIWLAHSHLKPFDVSVRTLRTWRCHWMIISVMHIHIHVSVTNWIHLLCGHFLCCFFCCLVIHLMTFLCFFCFFFCFQILRSYSFTSSHHHHHMIK